VKIYLSGPITGLDPGEVVRAFHKWEQRLLQDGHEVINPVNLDHLLDLTLGRIPLRHEYLRNDLKHLLECDEVLMIPGWSESKGAQLERLVASACGIPIRYWEEVS
jgi:hypothetical protein